MIGFRFQVSEDRGQKLRGSEAGRLESYKADSCPQSLSLRRQPCAFHREPLYPYLIPYTLHLIPSAVRRKPFTLYLVPCTVRRMPDAVRLFVLSRTPSPHRSLKQLAQFPQRSRIDHIILFQPAAACLAHPIAQMIETVHAVGV